MSFLSRRAQRIHFSVRCTVNFDDAMQCRRSLNSLPVAMTEKRKNLINLEEVAGMVAKINQKEAALSAERDT